MNEFAWFMGVVEDIFDPEEMNRVKVRCFNYHTENKAIISTDDLPWATVMMPTTASGTSGIGSSPHGLLQGSWVVGFFKDGKSAQDPVIMGSIASMSTAAATDAGFNDPTGDYPLEEYLNEPDVNKLARGENIYAHTPDSEIGEPASPYAAVYPKNHVYATESGHVKEYDDTPEAERIREYHKSGTFYEVGPDGDIITHIVRDKYTVIHRNDSIHVSGDVRMIVDGNWDVDVTGIVTIDAKQIYLNKDNGDAWAAARLGDTADTGDAGTGSHFDTNSAGTDKIETGSGTVFIGK